MRKCIVRLMSYGAVAGFCCCASGCVSLFANGIMMERTDPPGLYAGVRVSSKEIANGISEASSAEIIALNSLMILDLPLEAAMDTLLLPWTIIRTIEHNQRLKAFNESVASSDAEIGPFEGPSLTTDQVEEDETRAEREDWEK